jgi:hypothetical protein
MIASSAEPAEPGEPGEPDELDATAARISAVGSRFTTAAGLAGVAFAVLFTVSFALLRVGVPPADGQEFASWWEENRERVAAGTYLSPFVGIAFLWFVAAVRLRIGRGEGHFFSTVFLGSALLFIATIFVTGAAGGAVVAAADSLESRRAAEVAAFSRAFGYALLFGFAVKMGAMFMLVVASIGRQADAVPRWVVLFSVVLGVTTLIASPLWDPVVLVFPAWVAIVSAFIIRASLARRVSGVGSS